MNIEVSIVIPNYNGERLLDQCLQSVEAQTYKDFETIVIDDASTDHSIDVIEKYPVHLIQNEANLGFASSVNEGIKIAEGAYVLLLNNDVVLATNFLERMVDAITYSRGIFSVSPKMIRFYERDYLDDTGDNYTILGWVYKRGDGLPAYLYNSKCEVFSSCAGAGLYRKDVFTQIGYLDAGHFAYLEDVDLGWRARIHGYENVYAPDAVCYHIGSATMAKGQRYSNQKVFLSARNNVYIIYKNMPIIQLLVNLPFLAVGFGIKYIYFSRLGFEQDYREGFLEGLRTFRNCKKVIFKPSNLKNYFKIEGRMIIDTVKYAGMKLLGKAIDKFITPHPPKRK